MRSNLSIVAAAALASLLTACGSSETTAPAEELSAETAAPVASQAATEATQPASATPAASDAASAPATAVKGDPIRGKGGLEEKCLARVAKETGAKVNGTNRIEESQAAIEIYVNVEGATAPWKCHGYKDGTIDGVMFTGDEGAL